MLLGLVMVITVVAYQDTVTHKDSLPPPPVPAQAPPSPAPAPAPTIEQIRYMAGLKTATRGVAQVRDGVNRVVRTQQADSLTRRRAARRLGGLDAGPGEAGDDAAGLIDECADDVREDGRTGSVDGGDDAHGPAEELR